MKETASVIDAIKGRDLERVRSLIDQSPAVATAHDENGVSALLLALYYQRPDIAEVIRAVRADLDIFEAAALGDGVKIQALLTQEIGLVSAYTPDGFTALHLSAFFGQADAARVLLANGADPNAVARNQMVVQPLHSSAAAGHLAASQALIEGGADVNARQAGGYMPLHEAVMNDNAALVELFLTHGADPSLQLDDGRNAAALATERGDPRIKSLLEQH